MFRITEDSSSGSLVQCLAKNYKNDSIVSVDLDKVDVMAAYSDPLCVCVVHCAFTYSELHTRTHYGTAAGVSNILEYCNFRYLNQLVGTAVVQWLRCCATYRKVAGSIPAGVS